MNLKSLFEGNLRDTAVLALLVAMTVVTVSVYGTSGNSVTPVAANNSAAALTSISSNGGGGSVIVPAGYSCTPNPIPVTGVTARTIGESRLALSYDSNKKEALLTATFILSVNGGSNGVYIYQYPSIAFHDASGNYVYANTQVNQPIVPITRLSPMKDSYGQVVYWVAPNRNVVFTAVGTIDPKVLLSGTYTASVDGLIGENTLTNPLGFKIAVNPNQTNSQTIVGEITPYISNINPNQVNVGDSVTLTGQRLNLGNVYIDGNVLPTSGNSTGIQVATDGSSIIFKVPALSSGWHYVTVNSPSGMSNGVGMNVLVPVPTTTINATLDPSSPIASVVKISQIAQTQNVPLAVFDLKSSGTSTLQGFTVSINVTGQPISTLFSNVQIKVGSLTYSANSLGNGIVSFTNMMIPLPTNINVPITVLANVAQDTNGTLSGSTAVVSLVPNSTSITAIDLNYNSAQVNSNGIISGGVIKFTSCPTSSSATYVCPTANVPTVSNMSVIPSTVNQNQGASTTEQVTFTYNITAANNPIYISKTYGNAVFATSVGNVGSVTNVSFTDNDSTNDGPTYFYIAPGQTKSFTAIELFRGMAGSVSGVYKIVGLNYGTNTSGTGSTLVSSNIGQALTATIVF